MEILDQVKPSVTIDLCGLTCPAPLLGAKQVLDDLKPGQVLALVSDCPGTKDDLFIWTRHTDHEVVRMDTAAAPRIVFYIRKGKRPTFKANVTLDMQGVSCPGPIVEARKILEELKPGEILKLVSSCPASRDEVKTWTTNTRHGLLDTREIAAGVWEFYIRKG